MNKFLYISNPAILAIPIVESQEPLIDIKNRSELLYGPAPECELTKNCYTKIRQSVFERLCQAQKKLPRNWRFRLYEGFRSLAVQKILFDQEFNRVIARYPNQTYEKQFQETTRLVSPVINLDGSYNIPPHNTGAAIDIEIITESGELLDMGMAAKDWISVDPDICLSECTFISNQAQENRKLLINLMQDHGFINYPTEWWHFSYGDRYWAFYQPHKEALYGSADFLL